ncbi:hypothetical protein HYW21_01115 [Candidatus Woesearchaeota archaeon]|nr:hypothetical protein [Candidatus Woesearchaeota archaeon]
MRIILQYRPIYNQSDRIVSARDAATPLTKTLDVRDGTDIADLLPRIHGRGLALWSEILERPYGDYVNHGGLQAGEVYDILSSNVPKTINFMKS